MTGSRNVSFFSRLVLALLPTVCGGLSSDPSKTSAQAGIEGALHPLQRRVADRLGARLVTPQPYRQPHLFAD